MTKFRGAGCIFLAEDTGRICLGLRSRYCQDSGTWSSWGGEMDPDEAPQDTVAREAQEEAGYTSAMKLIPLNVYRSSTLEYHSFAAIVPKEFKPDINWEHTKFVWCTLETLPTPLHFGIPSLLPHLKRIIEDTSKETTAFVAKVSRKKETT